MPDVFQAYEPDTSYRRHSLRACEACYARKVRCDIQDTGHPCLQCSNHGVECVARTRKRKASAARHANAHDSPPADNVRQSTSTPDAVLQDVIPRNRASSRKLAAPMLFMCRTTDAVPSDCPSQPVARPRNSSSSFLSRSAILGDDFPDIDHAHGDRPGRESSLSTAELDFLQAEGAFELPEVPQRQSLYEAFVERCYPWMPVIEILSFEATLANGSGSLLLMQAVMLAGAIMRPEVYSKATVTGFYKRVKVLIHSGYEEDPLNTLSALCLMQWYTTAAPKDISMDSPRFWNTYAIGLAHQMGLHKASKVQSDNEALRRRIWFTLYVRDCLTSAAHGRPRLLNPSDGDLSSPRIQDFRNTDHGQAQLFVAYVGAASILGDLCQLVNRNGQLSHENQEDVAARIWSSIHSLPHYLAVVNGDGQAQPYTFNMAQLHILFLTSITILYRPSSVFSTSPSKAASIAAAFLSFRIFQAIQLRAETKYLGSAFAWYLLVASIPLMSCTRIPELQADCAAALDCLEECLATLGEVRPAAANNLKSVKAIRRAVSSTAPPARPRGEHGGLHGFRSSELLQQYGAEASKHAENIAMLLARAQEPSKCRDGHQGCGRIAAEDATTATGIANPMAFVPTLVTQQPPWPEDDSHVGFSQLFEDDLLRNASSWMMRDWIDDLQHFGS